MYIVVEINVSTSLVLLMGKFLYPSQGHGIALSGFSQPLEEMPFIFSTPFIPQKWEKRFQILF